MANNQVYTLTIKLNSQEAKARLEELSNKQKQLQKQKEQALAAGDTKAAQQFSKELKTVTDQMKQLNTTTKNVDNTLKNLKTASVKEIRDAMKVLNRQLTDGSVQRGTKEWTALQEKLKACKTELAGIRAESNASGQGFKHAIGGAEGYADAIKSALGLNNNFGNSLLSLSSGGNGIKGMFSAMGQAVSAFGKTLMGLLANPVFLTIAGVAGAGMAFKWWFDYNKGIAEASRLTTEFLGVTGDEMKAVRSEIQSIADTWGKDYKEVLQTVDALMAQYHISAKEAMQVVSDGFVAGADLSGNMLQQIQQYAPTFHDAGVSASELVAILSQTRSGIFSEQGMQVIEMASKRIREMSTATAKSLDAIHINSKQVTADLSSGAKSTFDVIKDISTALKQFPADSQEVGAVLKDVFGRQGAGAGIQLIEQLDTMSTDLEKVKEQTGEYGKALEAQKDATTELNAATAALFDVTDKGFESALVGAKTFCIQGLTMIVRGVIDVINYFRDWYNESLIVRAAVETINTNFKTLWSTVKLVFGLIIDGAKTAIKGLKGMADILEGMVTMDFDKVKRGFDDFVNSQIDGWNKTAGHFKDFGKESAQNYADGWNNAMNGKRLEHINVPTSVMTSNGQQVSLGGSGGAGGSSAGQSGKGGGGGGSKTDPVKIAMNSIDVQVEQAKLRLKEQYLTDATMTQKQYNDRMKEIEYQGLAQKLSIAGMEESEKAKILSRLYDMEIEMRGEGEDRLLSEQEKAFQMRIEELTRQHYELDTSEEEYQHSVREATMEYYDGLLEDVEISEEKKADIIKKKNALILSEEKEMHEKRKAEEEKTAKEIEDSNKQMFDTLKNLGSDFGKDLAAFITDTEFKLRDFAKATVKLLLDTLEKIMVSAIAERTIKNIATLGFAGIAKSAAEIAAITAAFEVAKGLLSGFEKGGFTGDGGYHEVAGVVHGGEFVANHQAVNNPNILPILQSIDQAQRNNTVGSWTPDQIGTSGVMVNNVYDNAQLLAMLAQLSKQLDEGIEAYTVIDGPHGLHKQYTHYQQLISK